MLVALLHPRVTEKSKLWRRGKDSNLDPPGIVSGNAVTGITKISPSSGKKEVNR